MSEKSASYHFECLKLTKHSHYWQTHCPKLNQEQLTLNANRRTQVLSDADSPSRASPAKSC